MTLRYLIKPLTFYTFFNLILLPVVLSLHEYGHWFMDVMLGYLYFLFMINEDV